MTFCSSGSWVDCLLATGQTDGDSPRRLNQMCSFEGGRLRTIRVPTLLAVLHIDVQDGVPGALETAPVQLGAARVWVAPDLPALTGMGELRDGLDLSGQRRVWSDAS